MNSKTRRRVEMGKRSLHFGTTKPDASPGYVAALARLGDLIQRADTLAAQQREGILEVRAASARKSELRRSMLRAHLDHVSKVAKAAADDLPDGVKLDISHKRLPYLVFRTAARSVQAEALSQKEVLVKHGLADTVLDSLSTALDEFDAALLQGTEGRVRHVGASAELDTVADEIVQVVNLMDGLNRVRFAHDDELLAAWESASNVVAASRGSSSEPGQPPAPGGEVKPAA
jgi:hypothetical protein